MKSSKTNWKHPKLPAGFGSVRYLGTGRKNPYAVHPPHKAGRLKTICYVPDWFTGVAVLVSWHAGMYRPGMEKQLSAWLKKTSGSAVMDQLELLRSQLAQWMEQHQTSQPAARAGRQVIAEHAKDPQTSGPSCITFAEAFELYYREKYGEGAPRKLSESAGKHARYGYRKLAPIADRPLDGLNVDELQRLINGIGLKESAVKCVLTAIKGTYQYALARELCRKNPAQYLVMPDVPESVHHQPFTDDELKILWEHQDDPMVRRVLIMCYSGFRYSAYETLETNLEKGYFRGGIKTEAGKNRVVPIHSKIMDLTKQTLQEEGSYLFGLTQFVFIRRMKAKMVEIGIDGDGRHHTPHSCRHTFSRLCESYGVRDADRRRMMGHSFHGDITNEVYGHRTLEELRQQIEKIQ